MKNVNYNFNAELTVVGRIREGTKVIAYIVQNKNGKQANMEKGKFEQLARLKKIYNCTGHVYKDGINLRGIGMRLNDLPSYNIHGDRIS